MRTFIRRAVVSLSVLYGLVAHCATAQRPSTIAAEGYITSINSTGFDVNAEHIAVRPETSYGLIGDKSTSSASPLRQAVQVGAYVEVVGAEGLHSKSVNAVTVLFRDDWNQQLSGIAVIERVIAAGPNPIFEADGYRIRVGSETRTAFNGSLHSLAEIGPNAWIHFEGKRDKDGTLLAAKAEFLPPKATRFKAVSGLEVYNIPFRPANSTGAAVPAYQQVDIPMEGGKVKLVALGGWRTIPAEKVLQDRVQSIGMKLVPEYQKQLSADDPSRIHFRFYALDDDKYREEICTPDGLILVPVHVVERLQNDDQLAAVLASGIALNLQRQTARVVAENRGFMGAEAASLAASAFIPGLNIAYLVGGSVVANRINTAREEERGRVALSLMANAGYDPWQAPEAWRLLAPRHLPKEMSGLKYPRRSSYQLGILNLQYRRASDAGQLNPPVEAAQAAQGKN